MRFVLPVLLLSQLSALADPPKVTAPETVVVGRVTQITAVPSAGKTLYYTPAYKTAGDPDAPQLMELAPPPTGGRAFMFQAYRDGVYPVVFWTDGEPTVVFLTVGKGSPNPGPQPNPGPNPDPTPVPPGPKAKHVYVATVRDPSAVNLAMAGILADVPYWDSLKKAGHEFDHWTNTSKVATDLGYVPAAKTLQTGTKWESVLLVLDKDTGRPLVKKVIPADATRDWIDAQIKGVTQ